MTSTPVPIGLSQVMFGSQQADLLGAAFTRLLDLELNENSMNAQNIGAFAAQVTTRIDDHYDEFAAALPLGEKANIERIARDNEMETRPATVEYLANAYLVRAIRDFFDLPARESFPVIDQGGFLVFTYNGSIVASPPSESLWRTLHYTRMPSRKKVMENGSLTAALLKDIEIGHCLRTRQRFRTSAIRMLLYVPEEKSDLFEAVRRSAVMASHSVSLMTRR